MDVAASLWIDSGGITCTRELCTRLSDELTFRPMQFPTLNKPKKWLTLPEDVVDLGVDAASAAGAAVDPAVAVARKRTRSGMGPILTEGNGDLTLV